MVLPCIGSHDQSTTLPSRLTARTNADSCSPTFSAPKRPISVRRPASLSGLRMSISRSRSSALSDGPHLSPSGCLMPRAVANPQHVARGGVPVAGGRIDAGERLLEAEQQRFMAGVEFGGAQLGMAFQIETAGLHEAERLGNAIRQFDIAARLR